MAKGKEWTAAVVLCLLAAAALCLLCSQSSPLYPTNTWDDANCLLTVGRVMRSGGVLYRDIYEQKGPTLYALHALAASVSDTDFMGVYGLETLLLAAALLCAYALLRRRMDFSLALGGAVLLGACLLVSDSFWRGDSAEEMCLPFLMGTLAAAGAEYGREAGPMRPKRLFVCGVLAGVVATVKFTILGLFIGLCLMEGMLALREGRIRRALGSAGVFLAGMLLPIVMWAAYFAWHGALGDAYTAYLYNNIFLYQEPYAFTERLKDIARAFRDNLTWALPASVGVCAFLANRRESVQERLAVLAMASGAFASVFGVGRVWRYSALVLGIFAVYGWAALMEIIGRRIRLTQKGGRLIGAGSGVLALWMALGMSPNAFLRGVPYEQTAQAHLAAYVEPGATLLQYSHLDDGLYLATGTLPAQKYFVKLNVASEEMTRELDRYLEEGLAEYVLVSWEELPARFGRYRLIAQDTGYDERNRLGKELYLYRRISE